MAVATSKNTRPCSRCKGKGFGRWVVQHGVCFKCNGCGHVTTLSMPERVRRFLAAKNKHRDEIEHEAKRLKEHNERGHFTQQIEMYRDVWKRLTAEIREVERTGKVTAKQQPATVPTSEV